MRKKIWNYEKKNHGTGWESTFYFIYSWGFKVVKTKTCKERSCLHIDPAWIWPTYLGQTGWASGLFWEPPISTEKMIRITESWLWNITLFSICNLTIPLFQVKKWWLSFVGAFSPRKIRQSEDIITFSLRTCLYLLETRKVAKTV